MRIRSLFRKRYYPLNKIEISSDALLNNYYYLSSLTPGIAIAPVLKSNAYGHGLVQIAKILDSVGAPFFCVDSLYEAYELLKNKIQTPLLIMGYSIPHNLKVKKLPFSYVVYDRAHVDAISTYQPHAGIHIFVDTGMHREGISLEDLPELLKYIQAISPFSKEGEGGFTIEGLMSHLAAPDQIDSPFTKKQIANFEKAKKIVRSAGFAPKWFHLSASSSLLRHNQRHGKIGNLARTGIALYGIDPENNDKHLQPVLQLATTLNQVKFLAKGEKIGYDFTYTAKKNMTIGILPLGFHDGVDRRLSNKGFVSISPSPLSRERGGSVEKVICRIIGRVSMNLTVVDLSAVKNPRVGETVVVYSNNPTDNNSINKAAQICVTIPYDLLVHLSATTKRIVF